MEPTFLTAIHIQKVRHLEKIDIPLSSDVRKNLILTGKNGSGKTSVLKAVTDELEFLTSQSPKMEIARFAKKIPEYLRYMVGEKHFKYKVYQ